MTKTYEILGLNRTDGRPALYSRQIMNCSACHPQGGTVPHAWPLTRTYSHFGVRTNLDAPPQHGKGEIQTDSYEMDTLVAWNKAVQDGIYPG